MSGIKTGWNPQTGQGDWAVVNGQLLTGGDLETAIYISLFSDRQANADDAIPDVTDDWRGWWGDMGEDKKIGSRLWLLNRAKLTSQTAARAKDYVKEALQWLIDDGIAAKIDIVTQLIPSKTIGMQVTVYKQNGTSQAFNYNWVWQGVS